jgi:hypothetical protein
MRLSGPDGHAVELRIANYQFPQSPDAPYDSNWLIIEGWVCHPRGSWSFRDACLMTYEVRWLADWLEALAAGKQERPWVTFTEPNLQFRLVETASPATLRVCFELECRPRWATRNWVDEPDLWIEFPLPGLNLLRAAESLRDQLQRYPQRTER